MSKFNDHKYKKYDTSNGFGNSQDWKDAFERRTTGTQFKPKENEEFPEMEKAETLAELKKAYRQLSKIYHPDMEGGNEETFKRLNARYEKLKKYIR